MKRYRLFTTICLVAAALLTACTQDEGMEQGTALPEGQYPLQIGGITLSAQLEQGEASPQTRVSENTDGSGSVFDNNDIIKVCIGDNYDNVGDYQLAVGDDGSITDITVVTPVYWTSTQSQTVHAWYTTGTDNTVSLANQSKGLAYVLKGTSGTAVNYNTPATLTFDHQLAKVQVKLTGRRSDAVTSVEVYGNTQCSHTNGNSVRGSDPDWIKMYPTTYNNEKVWEANLVPGSIQTDNGSLIRLNGSTTVAITDLNTLEEGAMHTLTVDVDAYPEGTQDITGTINGNGNYKVEGNRTEAITITGGSPHIYLYGANIEVTSGNAIDIKGGNPTIHVAGTNTVQCTGTSSGQEGAGIYVETGSSVTIQGSGRNDKLTVQASRDGAGIGGYRKDGTNLSCGSIKIKNVTVNAYAAGSNSMNPGIGSVEGCGNIEIEDAVVSARGYASMTDGAPAIGSYNTLPTIIISNSEIYAYRGGTNTSYADWIGRGGNMFGDYQGGNIQVSSISNTKVYKYRYNWQNLSDASEGTVEYGADGTVQ